MRLWQQLQCFLMEDPVGEQENRRLAGILHRALAESETDAGFERSMRSSLRRPTGLQTEREWHALLQRLYPYRRVGEETGHLRVIACRFLADVERRFPHGEVETAEGGV